jgi:hypothetical protein
MSIPDFPGLLRGKKLASEANKSGHESRATRNLYDALARAGILRRHLFPLGAIGGTPMRQPVPR